MIFLVYYSIFSGEWGGPTKGKPPQPPTTLDMSHLKKPLQTSSEFPATTLPTSNFLRNQQVKTNLQSHQAHGTSRDVPKATLRNTDIYRIYYFTNSKKHIPNMICMNIIKLQYMDHWCKLANDTPPLNINHLSSG